MESGVTEHADSEYATSFRRERGFSKHHRGKMKFFLMVLALLLLFFSYLQMMICTYTHVGETIK